MDKLSVEGLGQAIRNSTVMMELAREELARLLRENAELKAEIERLKPPEPTCETRACPICGR
jgi:cell division protein FtsB